MKLNHSPSSNAWICFIATPPNLSVAYCLINHRNNFYFLHYSVFSLALCNTPDPELAESGNSLVSKVLIYFSVPTNFVQDSPISPVF
jgi:hypothetical protein